MSASCCMYEDPEEAMISDIVMRAGQALAPRMLTWEERRAVRTFLQVDWPDADRREEAFERLPEAAREALELIRL